MTKYIKRYDIGMKSWIVGYYIGSQFKIINIIKE